MGCKEEGSRDLFIFETEKGYMHPVLSEYKNQPIDDLIRVFDKKKICRMLVDNDCSKLVRIHRITKVDAQILWEKE